MSRTLSGFVLFGLAAIVTFGVPCGSQIGAQEDIPPYLETPQNPGPVTPVPAPPPPVTFDPAFLPPPAGGSMCATNHSSGPALWTIESGSAEVPVGPIGPGDTECVTVPPGCEGLVFRFKVYLEINGVIVVVYSHWMSIPS